LLALLAGAFAFGLWVGVYQPAFYTQLRNMKRSVAGGPPAPLTSEQQMMASAFTDAMISDQIYPPVKSFSEIGERLKAYEVDYTLFPGAYAALTVDGVEQSGDHLTVHYQLAGKKYDAHAYASAQSKDCAAVVIPGSGQNQSSGLFAGDPENYHGMIAAAVRDFCDPVIYVKPNEDFTAIHNGSRKLNYTAIAVSLLNRGT